MPFIASLAKASARGYGFGTSIPAQAWNLSFASQTSPAESFFLAGQDSSPQGLFFKPDGSKMYFSSESGFIYEYTDTIPWDVNNLVYVQKKETNATTGAARGVFFRSDGLKMYISGQGGLVTRAIYEYDLSSAWDISTATYLQNKNVGTETSSVADLFFKSDGLSMYVLGGGGNLNQYTLSSAWDVSTASYNVTLSFPSIDPAAAGLFFRPDGTQFFTCGPNNAGSGLDGNVYSFTIATPWDLTTATYSKKVYVGNNEAFVKAVFFRGNGLQFWILGDSADTVFSYSIT
jgi:hypothetical protein